MSLPRDANGFVVLDRRACLERLALRRVAAVAITQSALPLVLPVVYHMCGEDMLMASARSGILGRHLPNSVVSLCVHDVDDDLLSGWTVTATGRAELVRTPDEVPQVEGLQRWASEPSAQVVVRISLDLLSGRLIL
jgi:uncharacterized protein